MNEKTPKMGEDNLIQDQEFVDIYIMGKKYKVPSSLTIMKAFEYAGYTLLRGCGCRAGFCGACSTVYRIGTDHELKVGLACQTKVEQDMYLTQIPFYPSHKVEYQLEELTADGDQIVEIFPEITKCLGCNACTNVCPQDLNVMKYISHAIRGEIDKVADESFDCLMCGLCASKCPANIVQYKVALLSRRLYGKYLAPKAGHLQERIKEIDEGAFEESLNELVNANDEILAEKYNNREIE
ncbi:4Fe-4S dicluster domain-containing protein [Maledivibacter halophilus]|uniref:CO dehydrogenase/acetyl-CoA synthase alpha subunit n=1 Tax=Maledivibacter halophilus TaxID=36842 RepID=A0A1T5LLB4_9FIRM|nr:4Fe-4S dicluster domain-containing protein [Maledivibacter halophilus]SKC76783.1 CO dehydrogenase/acetyl-CoA synthase alpha subunit [Maledivibacter halophilus]